MSIPTVHVDIDATSINFSLQKLADATSYAGMATFFFGFVETYLQERAKQRFENEGDAAVGQWEQLADATIEIRENLGFPGSHPINRRTGALEAYIVGANSTLAGNSEGMEYTFPGNLPHSDETLAKLTIAQEGGRTPAGSPVPARPVLGISETDVVAITAELGIRIGEVLMRV